jgi:putative ABC transport system permease protein
MQEVLAGSGIAVGVALVYAVLVSSTSITGSAAQIVDGVAGRASLQVTARSDRGFDERFATKAAEIPGVVRAVPLLRSNVRLFGPSGRRSVQLVGATPELAALGGEFTRNFGPAGLRLAGGIALPENVADALGIAFGDLVEIRADGLKQRVPIAAVLTADVLGALASTGSALAALPFAQSVSNRPGRLSQVFIETAPGATDRVRRELETLANNRLNVLPADAELTVLRQAAKPNDQSTRLFVMAGFLFSLNAMLFTVGERRRFIAALRLEGASPRQALTVLAFEAIALGAMASFAGLLLGELLLRTIFGDVPDYLTFAFPVGTDRIVQPWIVAFAFAAGMLAVLIASLRPALDLRSRAPLDAVNRERTEPGEAIGDRTARRMFWLGIVLIALTTFIALAIPAATIVGGATLAVAALLVMPVTFGLVASRLDRLTRSTGRFNMLALALTELRATTTRSVALTAVAALAVYGSVAIGGARHDIVRGLDSHTRQWLSNADIWITTGGQDLMTNSFSSPDLPVLRDDPRVRSVRVHRGGFLDVDGRRIWLVGRPATDRTMIPASQMLDGDRERATRQLRRTGWATASAALADEQGIDLGESFTIPTPTGDARFRLAATTMNFGWIPGAVNINNRDYARVMNTAAPSAIEIDLAPGVSPSEGKEIVTDTLGPDSGLTVQTRQEREVQYYEFGREGVARLSQIAALLLLAAALAVACALAATLWQRGPRLAALTIQGAQRAQLWRAMLCETGLLVAIGCFVGAILGVYGHLLAGRFLRTTTGFASPFAVEPTQLLLSIGLVAGVALAISAVLSYLAAGVPARASFRE